MKQNEMDRKNFWNNGGETKEELFDYINLSKDNHNTEFSVLDEWLTLLCC